MEHADFELSADEWAAVDHLNLARRHARTLERLAVLTLVLGLFAGLLTSTTGDVILGCILVLVGGVVWGVLRALALALHLAVDRALLVDD